MHFKCILCAPPPNSSKPYHHDPSLLRTTQTQRKKNNSKNKLSIVARSRYTIHAERATDHPMPRHEQHQTLRSCTQIRTIEPRRRRGKLKLCTERQKLPGRWGSVPGLRRFGHEPFQ
ncbi:hypothetical protein FH972_017821 [Carpinus fangiana]|uniref:Uncharacterized protein n=1 Tax=Carpinus fangiana TaxID=176857 RepID=A0A5N6RN30_9ROSI|nr:hypothetical protein FH972_017821 [Carpinus fangiana]